MFTGIIEATGRIASTTPQGAGRVLRVATALGAELALGESIAVSGVCLTVTSRDASGFAADVSPETLRATTLGSLAEGSAVNLERSMKLDGRLGGHFVLGHVDGVGQVAGVRPDGDCRWIDIAAPAEVAPFMIAKGSIAVDGISLTIASINGARFGVQIVPFTLAHTSLAALGPGDTVNLEGDMIGKYVARLMGKA